MKRILKFIGLVFSPVADWTRSIWELNPFDKFALMLVAWLFSVANVSVAIRISARSTYATVSAWIFFGLLAAMISYPLYRTILKPLVEYLITCWKESGEQVKN
jgi:hypothetical protein